MAAMRSITIRLCRAAIEAYIIFMAVLVFDAGLVAFVAVGLVWALQ
jgi:hypothetical protein